MKESNYFFLIISISFLLESCVNNDPSSVPLSTITYSNLNADVGTSRDSLGKAFGTTGHFKFFSFRSGQPVANADSLTTKWDVGFRGTTIIVNGGPQRKGLGGAIVLNSPFDNLQSAPEDGYDVDSLVTINTTSKLTYAIPDAVNSGWYTFNASTLLYSAIPNKVIVVRTADKKYAKMEIINFYKNSPTSPKIQTDFDRYYTFKYVYQTNGGKSFN